MNRRDALAALMSLPAATTIRTIPAASDDVIVIESDCVLSEENARRIRDECQGIWPGRKVVVFGRGLKIKLAPS